MHSHGPWGLGWGLGSPERKGTGRHSSCGSVQGEAERAPKASFSCRTRGSWEAWKTLPVDGFKFQKNAETHRLATLVLDLTYSCDLRDRCDPVRGEGHAHLETSSGSPSHDRSPGSRSPLQAGICVMLTPGRTGPSEACSGDAMAVRRLLGENPLLVQFYPRLRRRSPHSFQNTSLATDNCYKALSTKARA